MRYVTFPFFKQAALGIGAAAVVIGSVSAAWFAMPHTSVDPASVLPANRTVAVFENVDAQTLAFFSSSFPILQSVPQQSGHMTVALLKEMSGSTIGWMTLVATANSAHPFQIQTSGPGIAAVTSGQSALSSTFTYHALLPDSTDVPWAFIRFPDIQINASSPLGHLVSFTSPASIALENDGASIHMLDPQAADYLQELPSAPKDVFASPLFIADMTDMGDAILHLTPALSKNASLTIQSVLQQMAASLFGQSISLRYDVIALLHGPTTVQVEEGSGSALRVVLEGSLLHEDAKETIDHLADLFKQTLTSVTKDTQTFDKKFTITDMRMDPSLVSDTAGQDGSWATRTIQNSQTHASLFVATRGNEFVISNDQAAFQKTLEAPANAFSPTDTIPSGLGLIRSNDLGALLGATFPTLWQNLTIPSGTGGYLKWKVTTEGQRVTVVIERI